MGKILDYLQQLEREKRTETVAEFAAELRKPVDSLMQQLREAGVEKLSETDPLSRSDKEALLRFLQKSHGGNRGRKKIKINIESAIEPLLKAVAAQENGSEWACLEYFSEIVLSKGKVESKLQEVVNLIIAKSTIIETLPIKKLGRPKLKESDDIGRKVAKEYWDLRDGGSTYSEAVAHLAEKIHKDERHVMRLVGKHKGYVGATIEDREQKRQWEAVMKDLYLRSPESFHRAMDIYKMPTSPEFTGNDYIEYLDERIVEAIGLKIPTDIKERAHVASD